MKIWNATIHTMTDAGILENGYVCIENGKITEVGTGTPSVLAPEDIDAGGRKVPGGKFSEVETDVGLCDNKSLSYFYINIASRIQVSAVKNHPLDNF